MIIPYTKLNNHNFYDITLLTENFYSFLQNSATTANIPYGGRDYMPMLPSNNNKWVLPYPFTTAQQRRRTLPQHEIYQSHRPLRPPKTPRSPQLMYKYNYHYNNNNNLILISKISHIHIPKI